MALIIALDNKHGIDQPLYWRLNNFDALSNREPDGRRLPAVARFRGFLSEDAFRAGKHFLDEMLVEFVPTSASADMAAEAYVALRSIDHTPGTASAVEALDAAITETKREFSEIERQIASRKTKAKRKPGDEEEQAEGLRNRLSGLNFDLDAANEAYLHSLAHRDALRDATDA